MDEYFHAQRPNVGTSALINAFSDMIMDFPCECFVLALPSTMVYRDLQHFLAEGCPPVRQIKK